MKSYFYFVSYSAFQRKVSILLSCLSALLMLTLAQAPRAFGATTYYEMTVHNNFGPGEFYGATPTDDQIWLLTDYQLQYQESGVWKTLNPTPAQNSYSVLKFRKIDQGKVCIMPNPTGATKYGQRCHAILSDTEPPAVQPSDETTTMPYNYFEWAFIGTAAQGKSTAAVSAAIAAYCYCSQPQFAWLGTGEGGVSKKLTFPVATDPMGGGCCIKLVAMAGQKVSAVLPGPWIRLSPPPRHVNIYGSPGVRVPDPTGPPRVSVWAETPSRMIPRRERPMIQIIGPHTSPLKRILSLENTP